MGVLAHDNRNENKQADGETALISACFLHFCLFDTFWMTVNVKVIVTHETDCSNV